MRRLAFLFTNVKEEQSDENSDQDRRAESERDKNYGRKKKLAGSDRKLALGADLRHRVFAEPLNVFFVFHGFEQFICARFVARIEDKSAVVSDPAIVDRRNLRRL